MRALGLDPGLAHVGWAVVDLDPLRPIGLGVIRTAKDSRKVLATVDLHRRGQQIARALTEILAAYPVGVCCAESISWVRSASTMAGVGRAWGVIDAVLEARGIGLVQASPQEIKQAVCGRKSASKAEILDALDERFAGAIRRELRAIRATTLHEHPVDAIGAVVACLDRDEVRIARASSRMRTEACV